MEIDDIDGNQNTIENTSVNNYVMFTRATRDIFHQFHTLSLPKRVPSTMQIFHLVQQATWIYNDEDFNSVVDILATKGVEDITRHQYFNKKYWNKKS